MCEHHEALINSINRSTFGIVLVVALVEAYLFTQYKGQDASIHFFVHSLVGITVTFLLYSFFRFLGKKPSHLIITAFVLHQIAMFPDYLYAIAHQPHRPWMNVFFGHLFFDDLPYHDIVLPVMAFVSGLVYWLVLQKTKTVR